MTRGYFVTGTDTGVGKTSVSLGLMRLLQSQGHVVTGMKPVASGCQATPAGLVNDDALKLQAQASFSVPYQQVNPYAFEPPIAPHIAAAQAGEQIRFAGREHEEQKRREQHREPRQEYPTDNAAQHQSDYQGKPGSFSVGCEQQSRLHTRG